MKIAIYTYSDNFTTQLAIETIPKGVEPIECKEKDELVQIIAEDKEIILIVTESTEMEFLEKVKEVRPDVNIFLIIHKSYKPKDMMKLLKIGIRSLIEFAEDTSRVGDAIIENIIQNNIRTDDRRQHVRVTPNPFEKSIVAIYIRDLNRFVNGELIDVSTGGAAVKLFDSLDASILSLNGIYDPFIIQIRGMDIKAVAKLMGKRQDMAGFRFENIEKVDMSKLSGYIHMRISENSRRRNDELMQEK